MSDAYFALAGVLFGAAIPIGYQYLKDFLSKRKRARYLALRVVILLDEYAKALSSVAQDDGNLNAHGVYEENTITTEIPNAPVFPTDVDWLSIDQRLCFDILAIDNLHRNAQDNIQWAQNYFSMEHEFEELTFARREVALELGQHAVNVAKKLRSAYNIPTAERAKAEGDPEEILAEIQGKLIRKSQLPIQSVSPDQLDADLEVDKEAKRT